METPNKKVVKKQTRNEPSPEKSNNKASPDNRAERVKGIITVVQEQKKKIEDIEKNHDKIRNKVKNLKKDIYEWMKKSGNEKIVFNSHSFNPHHCVALKRTSPSDILDVVLERYGEDNLRKVIDELDRLHTVKYEGQYDVRFLSEVGEKRSRAKNGKPKTERPEKKPKNILIL